MTTDDDIRHNEELVLAHCDTEPDVYTRCVLKSMLHEAQNPNQRDHTGPLTVSVIERWARGEEEIASHQVFGSFQEDRCAHAARVLRDLQTRFR